jgi:hypothetical protein
MEQKKFMDIERLREFEVDLGDGIIKSANAQGFEYGDWIVIQEKVDGACASCRYDSEANCLVAFSRKKQLDYKETLRGFWNYIQSLDVNKFRNAPNLVFFGEWLVSHTVKYRQESYGKWYLFDIYDLNKEQYLTQKEVKLLAKHIGLEYIHTLYEGKFISWEHCKSFCNSPAYGENQEGIVCKNMTKLTDLNNRFPYVLKIVNDSFSETKKSNHIRKEEDPQRIKEKAYAQELIESVLTKNRVMKEIHKMVDEGVLPSSITPQDMKTVAQNLPSRIYNDLIKEEIETLVAAGEYGGKICSSVTMKYAKEIILGIS